MAPFPSLSSPCPKHGTPLSTTTEPPYSWGLCNRFTTSRFSCGQNSRTTSINLRRCSLSVYNLMLSFKGDETISCHQSLFWSLKDIVSKAPHLLLLIRPPFSKLQRSESPPTLLSNSRHAFASTSTSTARSSGLRLCHSTLQTVPLPIANPHSTLVGPWSQEKATSFPPVSPYPVCTDPFLCANIPSIGPGARLLIVSTSAVP